MGCNEASAGCGLRTEKALGAEPWTKQKDYTEALVGPGTCAEPTEALVGPGIRAEPWTEEEAQGPGVV